MAVATALLILFTDANGIAMAIAMEGAAQSAMHAVHPGLKICTPLYSSEMGLRTHCMHASSVIVAMAAISVVCPAASKQASAHARNGRNGCGDGKQQQQ